jgi:hypothetical protein
MSISAFQSTYMEIISGVVVVVITLAIMFALLKMFGP